MSIRKHDIEILNDLDKEENVMRWLIHNVCFQIRKHFQILKLHRTSSFEIYITEKIS